MRGCRHRQGHRRPGCASPFALRAHTHRTTQLQSPRIHRKVLLPVRLPSLCNATHIPAEFFPSTRCPVHARMPATRWQNDSKDANLIEFLDFALTLSMETGPAFVYSLGARSGAFFPSPAHPTSTVILPLVLCPLMCSLTLTYTLHPVPSDSPHEGSPCMSRFTAHLIPFVSFFEARRSTDPLVHFGRHFGRTIHALCNVHTILCNGVLQLGDKEEGDEAAIKE